VDNVALRPCLPAKQALSDALQPVPSDQSRVDLTFNPIWARRGAYFFNLMKKEEISAWIVKAIIGAVVGTMVTMLFTHTSHPVTDVQTGVGAVGGATTMTMVNTKIIIGSFIVGMIVAAFAILMAVALFILLSPIGM
jgi:hypothetical protein